MRKAHQTKYESRQSMIKMQFTLSSFKTVYLITILKLIITRVQFYENYNIVFKLGK